MEISPVMAISRRTGAPVSAEAIAVQTVTEWLTAHPDGMERVIFNVFKDEDKAYYEAELF